MPTITIYEPDPAFNPFTSPLLSTGVFTLDDNSNPFVITGSATYTFNGVPQTVNGMNIITGRDVWQMDFSIPHPGVTVTVTVYISENGGAVVASSPITVVMA